MGQVVPFRIVLSQALTKYSTTSSLTSVTGSSTQSNNAIRLANKLQLLALHEPSALKAIENIVDQRLARFGAMLALLVSGGLL